MHSTKRLIIAALSGVLFGLACFGLACCSPEALAWPVAWQIISSRTLIGIAIGLSSLRLGHWTLHGFVLGLVFSLPLAFSGLMAPESAEYSKGGMFFGTLVLGGVYGLLIELITTVLFKAGIRSTVPGKLDLELRLPALPAASRCSSGRSERRIRFPSMDLHT